MIHRSLVLTAGLFLILPFGLGPVWADTERASERRAGTWQAVVAPPEEPGERLRVTGRIFAADGETPLAGVKLYVYQTDRTGHYSEGGQDRQNPRLHGTLHTDSEGRYLLETIRPGRYPGDRVPAHIHYQLTYQGGSERHDLFFAGDPALSQRQQTAAQNQGRFASIQPIEERAGGMLHCVRDIRSGFDLP